jgi:hypothetical protein
MTFYYYSSYRQKLGAINVQSFLIAQVLILADHLIDYLIIR